MKERKEIFLILYLTVFVRSMFTYKINKLNKLSNKKIGKLMKTITLLKMLTAIPDL